VLLLLLPLLLLVPPDHIHLCAVCLCVDHSVVQDIAMCALLLLCVVASLMLCLMNKRE
jgi:hypothetical protein